MTKNKIKTKFERVGCIPEISALSLKSCCAMMKPGIPGLFHSATAVRSKSFTRSRNPAISSRSAAFSLRTPSSNLVSPITVSFPRTYTSPVTVKLPFPIPATNPGTTVRSP